MRWRLGGRPGSRGESNSGHESKLGGEFFRFVSPTQIWLEARVRLVRLNRTQLESGSGINGVFFLKFPARTARALPSRFRVIRPA
jgi:hypothetical protein